MKPSQYMDNNVKKMENGRWEMKEKRLKKLENVLNFKYSSA